MQEIKKISVLSVFKITFLIGIISGALMALYAYFALPMIIAADPSMALQFPSSGFAAIATSAFLSQVILVPVVSVICVLLYNLFAKMVGGIKVDCIETSNKKKK
jgi:hypothetical protein